MKSEKIPKLGGLILLSVLFSITNFASCDNEIKLSPVVKTNQGNVQGITLKSRNGKDYYAYWGIPYAKPPKRFQSPSPAEPWEGVRNATTKGSECLQFLFELSGSEDCLFINVFTSVDLADTSKVATEKRPVIFYIHGGAFRFGNSDMHGADYLMDEPVVFVTINYRLLAMGFLNLGKLRTPSKNNEYNKIAKGNMGMKDQVLALKWVQENIHYFGGDRNRVTIFGTSAGAVSVSHHVLSPMSKGLFHAAISSSGIALNHFAFTTEPEEFAEKLATSLNCSTSNSDELIKCLLETDVNVLAAKSHITTVWPLDPIASFVPSLESLSDDAFLLEEPETLLKEGRFNKVPWIVGAMKCEGSLFHANTVFQNNGSLFNVLMNNWDTIAPVTFGYGNKLPKSAWPQASSEVKNFFLGRPEPQNISLADLYGDSWYINPARSTALLYAKHSPVYPYIFEFTDGQFVNPFHLKFPEGFKEATHGDDARYAFSGEILGTEIDPANTEAVEFSKKFVKLIVSFAETGKPDAGIFGSTWPATTKEEAEQTVPFKWFHFLQQSNAISSPESGTLKERMEFWDNLLKKYKK